MKFKKCLGGGGYGYLIIPYTQERKEGKHSKKYVALFSSEVTL